MTINYIKYFDSNDDTCNKVQFFSSYMDAYERRNEILKLKEKYGDDVIYDGQIGTFEYFNRRELIEELNKVSNVSFDTFPGHIL